MTMWIHSGPQGLRTTTGTALQAFGANVRVSRRGAQHARDRVPSSSPSDSSPVGLCLPAETFWRRRRAGSVMMAARFHALTREEDLEHLLRRAGFGATDSDVNAFARLGLLSFSTAVAHLVDYSTQPDDVDDLIGQVRLRGRHRARGLLARGQHQRCAPALAVPHGAQRASAAGEDGALLAQPLRHRATARSPGDVGATEARALHGGEAVRRSRRRARADRAAARARARQLPRSPARRSRKDHGDARLARRPHQHRRRSRRRTSAARSWSCSRWASAHYTEADVYAGARVFTGWNLARPAQRRSGAALRVQSTTRAQHDTTAKTFSFPIYADGSKTIPARAAADGMQDGLDLIDALARHPADRRAPGARSCTGSSSARSIDAGHRRSSTGIAAVYLQSDYDMKPVVRELLLSPQFSRSVATTSRATPGRPSSSCAR